MALVLNVNCMMCGRASGHVRNGSFVRLPNAPALIVRGGRSRCGFCGGNVYLEAEDSPVMPHGEAFADDTLGARRDVHVGENAVYSSPAAARVRVNNSIGSTRSHRWGPGRGAA